MIEVYRQGGTMRLIILFFAASIIAVVLDSTSVCSVANADDSATFEWTDDKGTVTFSDNPTLIPDKYGKRVKKRATIKGETPQVVQYDRNSSPIRREPTHKAEIYGGHDEGWWRGQFSGTRTEIERIKEGQESKQQNLKTLHYKKVVSNSSQTDGIFGSPRKNRQNYRVAYYDILEDEKRIKVLEQKLIELENEAARYGVPLEWRR
jgi:hypothetical protein